MTINRLEHVTDANWRDFLQSPVAVLTLSVSSCPVCSQWVEELGRWSPTTAGLPPVAVGRVVLDGAETADFKRANDWLDHVPGLPFTAIFAGGEPVSSFAGTGTRRLEARLRQVAERTHRFTGDDSPPTERRERPTS